MGLPKRRELQYAQAGVHHPKLFSWSDASQTPSFFFVPEKEPRRAEMRDPTSVRRQLAPQSPPLADFSAVLSLGETT